MSGFLKEESSRELRLVSITSVPRKIIEQILKGLICKHLEDNVVIRNNQRGFVPNRSC